MKLAISSIEICENCPPIDVYYGNCDDETYIEYIQETIESSSDQIISMDFEWNPFSKSVCLDLLQIGIDENVFLIRIKNGGKSLNNWHPYILSLFESNPFTLWKGKELDTKRVHSLTGVTICGFDIHEICNYFNLPLNLNCLCEMFNINMILPKDKKVSRSPWHKDLSNKMMKYASGDVYACRMVLKQIEMLLHKHFFTSVDPIIMALPKSTFKGFLVMPENPVDFFSHYLSKINIRFDDEAAYDKLMNSEHLNLTKNIKNNAKISSSNGDVVVIDYFNDLKFCTLFYIMGHYSAAEWQDIEFMIELNLTLDQVIKMENQKIEEKRLKEERKKEKALKKKMETNQSMGNTQIIHVETQKIEV
eukprot:TRINITY_DN3121_c5_g4_i1.p1 TRINITY_DN3121_c5_g4~~TRINITY_DN3121_c5_g4_i1.p1  ORF type:complete len:382 (+),score=94.55 TRINITY_DN3121_c5_g4_i1:63-1148(+)